MYFFPWDMRLDYLTRITCSWKTMTKKKHMQPFASWKPLQFGWIWWTVNDYTFEHTHFVTYQISLNHLGVSLWFFKWLYHTATYRRDAVTATSFILCHTQQLPSEFTPQTAFQNQAWTAVIFSSLMDFLAVCAVLKWCFWGFIGSGCMTFFFPPL